MGKITKAVKQKSRRSKTKSRQPSTSTLAATPTIFHENWVDRLEFESKSCSSSQDEDEEEADETRTLMRIISFNILAQAYLSPRSHRGLPTQYRNIVFDPSKRQQVLSKVLRRLAEQTNVLCLQEVDMKIVKTTLNDVGFDGISTPTSNAAGGRVDACCIFWDTKIWSLVNEETIKFDDLASLGTAANQFDTSISGLRQSFLRRNVAILARLRHLKTQQQIVVANAHLFWNPNYDFVKLCQAHLLTQRARTFATTATTTANGNEEHDPIVICGDLNSKPHNSVHTYLTTGSVNAKSHAPWYNPRGDDDDDESQTSNSKDDETDEFLLSGLQKLKLSEKAPEIRYLLDYTLNRFCRWLRILGIDAALETEEEEIERTKNSNLKIFHRCREEGRTLVTTSYKLMQRKDCPSGAYLINAKTIPNLELSLVHLLSTHGVILRPENFLARCVVCNGNICTVSDEEKKKSIFRAYQAPELATQGLECYECDGCGQGYWWDDRPTSSASRVKTQATHLFELCLRGGVQMDGPLHMFDMVNVEAQRQRGLDENTERESMEVVKWLKDEQLRCPIALQSAYALKDEEGNIVGESKPFSNVTADFVGLLDYVLFESESFQLTGNLYVPTSFNDLSKNSRLRNGYVLPSDVWPSDHLAVGAELVLLHKPTTRTAVGAASVTSTTPPVPSNIGQEVNQQTGPSSDEGMIFCGVIGTSAAPPPIGGDSAFPIVAATPSEPPHAPKCGCGCVPNVRSLFEMAELRKQHKARKEARVALKQGRSA